MSILELKCLGQYSILHHGALMAGIKSIKGLALFCYLAVCGKPFARSVLAGMFWGEMPENQALMNLRKALHRLKPLSAYLVADRETVAFNQKAPLWMDVKEFEAGAVARADIPRLQAAASLYKGDFLEGFEVDETPLFANWVSSQRAHLRELALSILQILIRYFSDRRDYPMAIQYIRKYLSIEPWSEETHRDLMRLLSLSGQRGAAIQQYASCRRILKEELGVEPMPETILLYEQIAAGMLSGAETGPERAVSFAALTPVTILPAMTTPLIGRLEERATLLTYLADPLIRLVSITGAGGMGKTHLALSLAHEVASGYSWSGGVFFVPLAAVTTRQHFIQAVADRLTLNLSGAHDPEKLLLAYLHDKNYLIVLDNFEQLLSVVDVIERILSAAPSCKLLITTRERTRLLQEWVLDLGGLPYPENMNDFQESDAILLFEQRARQRFAGFSLENNFSAVARICQLVQGMPLALELAASWIRAMTATEIAEQIATGYHSLSSELRDLPERHRTMYAVFESSWIWLNAAEQSVMRRLAVFQGGFSLEAAQQVTGASVPLLSALVDKSFVSLDTRSSEMTRYQVHELIRQFATDQLEAGGEVIEAKDRHLRYFLDLVNQAEKAWDSPQEIHWLRRFEVERANLHAALGWALDQGKNEILLRMNAGLFTFWVYRNPISEGNGWIEASLSMTWDEEKTDVLRLRAKILNIAGYSALVTSNYLLSQERFSEGLALYSRLGDQKEIAWSLRGCGYVAMLQGNYDQAQPYVERSLAICQEIHDEWGAAWSIYDLGYLALVRGDLAQARELLDNSRQQFRRYGVLFGEYRALIALGEVFRKQNNGTQARSYFQEALVFQQQYQFIHYSADALEGLALLALTCEESTCAARLYGVAQKRRDTIELARPIHLQEDYQNGLHMLHERLPDDKIFRAWDEGYAMSVAEAIACALEASWPAS